MQVQWYYMWLAVVKTSWDFISEVNFHGCILFKVLFILSKFTCYVSCFCVSLVPFVLYIVKFKFVDFWNSCILLSRENKMSIYPRKKKKNLKYEGIRKKEREAFFWGHCHWARPNRKKLSGFYVWTAMSFLSQN